jgi:FHS family L-fucose permease-like MFS transporter
LSHETENAVTPGPRVFGSCGIQYANMVLKSVRGELAMTPTHPVSTTVQRKGEIFPRENAIPFFLVTALFFLWGIPNNLNDVLIKHFMTSFEITRFKAGLVQSAFYFGYFAFSMPAALVLRKFGYQRGLVGGLILYGTGAILFWPAAVSGSYYFFLFALFVIASGLAFLETGASPFIAQIGPPETAERRLNFSQAFNPLGSISGVLVGTTFIFSALELNPARIADLKASGRYAAVLHEETMRVIMPYIVLAVIVFLWALLLAKTRFPKLGDESATDKTADHGHYRELLRYPHFIKAVLAQFFYVGAQVGTWSYFIQYVQDYTNQSEKVAGYFLTGTLAAFAIGRFAATYLMKYIAPNVLMGLYSLVNVALVAIGVLMPGWIGLWAIFATSFFMSLMFPTIFGLGLRDLGPNTKLGGSLLVMAIIGGAVFTPAMGLVAEASGSMARAMIVPLLCYLFIAYFSYYGSNPSQRA